jgi:transcription antitermination factor NusG
VQFDRKRFSFFHIGDPMGLGMAEPRPVPEKLNLPQNGNNQHWYAVQAAPRHEKKVTAALDEKRFTTFLPVVTETHYWSDRKQKVEVPLFAGYTFVRLTPSSDERIAVLRSKGVVRLVGKEHVGTPIPEKEIHDIWTLVNSRLKIEPYPFLDIGDRVRISSGSLAGVEGILTGKASDETLVVSVNLLHRSLAVRLQGFDVLRIRGASPVRSSIGVAA